MKKMEKLKINTMSGGVLEKPLVTAFKSGTGEYVVVDNEMNGTMGLPIILVSKLVNNTLSLIPDSEWNAVKEALRLIISGNQVDYISVPEAINAEDMFFKQLTLPVASFEALKNNYKPVVLENVMPTPQVEVAPAAPEVMSAPEVEPMAGPVTPEVTPMQSEVVNPVEMQNVNPAPRAPVMPSAPVESQTVAPVMPEVEVTPMPSVEPIPEPVNDIPVDFTADKEAFLKACENMFDALVAKFNNK